MNAIFNRKTFAFENVMTISDDVCNMYVSNT